MARKQSHFELDLWDKARQKLDSLPEKPKAEIKASIKDGLARIKDSISKAKKMGYSQEEIVATLKDAGIDISLTSFKSYFPKKSKKSKNLNAIKNIPVNPKIAVEKSKKISTKDDFNNDDDV